MSKRLVKALVFLAALGPFGWLVWATVAGQLGANPVDTITKHTGIWTLRMLLAALSITPARRLLGWPVLASYRRMVGLFAFFYGALHFATLVVFDHSLDVVAIWDDVKERPFITAGFIGFVLMLPLAATSPARAVKWLGGRRWQQLHRLVYVCGAAGVIHYLWLVKADVRPPLGYAAWYAAAMAVRLAYRLKWLGGPQQRRVHSAASGRA